MWQRNLLVWRKLAVAIRNSGGFPPSAADSAIQRAYDLLNAPDIRLAVADDVVAFGEQFEEGHAVGKRVAIHVEKFNPARRLYARLGFREVQDLGIYLKLEC